MAALCDGKEIPFKHELAPKGHFIGRTMMAVEASWHTCERCGATEGVNTNLEGYRLTLCPDCRKEIKPRVIVNQRIDYEQKYSKKQVHEEML